MFEDEEEVEGLEKVDDINFLRDKEGLIQLTKEEYEYFMSYTKNNEVISDHSMVAVDHKSIYKLILKNIDDN